ncbi:Glycosyltransferase involved in cell wall bisynthesis [Roseovarius pacificus]|uniref:Glycosyltransferase involved in cell wall bisynthesis n=1 Tax=Roseovarius pacificus TaxID=337701 RepID=A0A1M7HPT1_9RHOB|nr:glycosyltransferase family 4 protein [Roseovarius pacificus]GGO60560.1 hypothetical protein GCM10011315_35270 [Roseovarius pacificus]SHM30551.1 Glycosyltransferase involved in cell wall bisynthesis [Roseovarius pacificus]
MMDSSRLKVLIVAPNASARMGGEAFLPLKYFQLLRQRGYPARLIAHSRNRDELIKALPDEAEHIYFIEDTRYHRAVWRLGKRLPVAVRTPLIGNLINQINEVCQRRLIRDLLRKGLVDLIHQPIPVSPRAPSRIYGFGVPVVIGPMNGNMSYPEGYEDYESRASRLFVPAARTLGRLANVLIPGKRRADVLLVANERTRAGLPVPNRGRAEVLVENGVDLSVWSGDTLATTATAPGALKLVFMGRLIPLKGLDFSIEAVRLARQQGADVTLDILGDGPERAALEAQVAAEGLTDHIRFHGFRSQADCADVLRASDALILNSLRECGGAVVLEAMSMGRPVIAADWGGPADYIDPGCGILVPPVPRQDFPDRLAHAILDLANSPETRQTMGEAGIKKIQSQFDWQKKIDRVLGIYHEVVEKHR